MTKTVEQYREFLNDLIDQCQIYGDKLGDYYRGYKDAEEEMAQKIREFLKEDNHAKDS